MLVVVVVISVIDLPHTPSFLLGGVNQSLQHK